MLLWIILVSCDCVILVEVAHVKISLISSDDSPD